MNGNDHNKLLKAGFTIIRSDFDKMRIKKLSTPHAWSTLENNFETKSALNARMKELLKSDMIVEN